MFQVDPVLNGAERFDRMEANLKRTVSRLKSLPARPGKTLSVVGYSPSLATTWERIQSPILTTSGAHDFLVQRGKLPDWHVEVDPREHKARMLRQPLKRVTYCLASTCHDAMFDAVAGFKVRMWHQMSDALLRNKRMFELLRADGLLLQGGSTAGLRALAVGYALGYRKFELYGMDCSYARDSEGNMLVWAGPHTGDKHNAVRVKCNGVEYDTSPTMLNAADELFFTVFGMMPDCKVSIHGNGLVQERLRLMALNEKLAMSAEWWEPVGWTRKKEARMPAEQTHALITEEYRKALTKVLITVRGYGTDGARIAPSVRVLMEQLATEDVLDYGCGWGELGREIPSCHSYDPAVPEYAQPPAEADIVVCKDVLCAVEPQCLEAVIRDLHRLARRALLVEVETKQSETVPYAILRDAQWWLDVLQRFFGKAESALLAADGRAQFLFYKVAQAQVLEGGVQLFDMGAGFAPANEEGA